MALVPIRQPYQIVCVFTWRMYKIVNDKEGPQRDFSDEVVGILRKDCASRPNSTVVTCAVSYCSAFSGASSIPETHRTN